jgi:hypothetical protein
MVPGRKSVVVAARSRRGAGNAQQTNRQSCPRYQHSIWNPGPAPGFLLVGVRYRPTADSRPVAVATRETMLEDVKISRLAIEALVIVISILVALLMLLYASTCKVPIV